MNKDVVYTHSRILPGYKKEGKAAICHHVDGTRVSYAKRNNRPKKDKYRRASLIHGIEETKQRNRRAGSERRKGNKPQETLHDREQTEGWWREVGEGVWARRGRGVKEGTCAERWVSHIRGESLNSAPETNIGL